MEILETDETIGDIICEMKSLRIFHAYSKDNINYIENQIGEIQCKEFKIKNFDNFVLNMTYENISMGTLMKRVYLLNNIFDFTEKIKIIKKHPFRLSLLKYCFSLIKKNKNKKLIKEIKDIKQFK